MLDTYTVHVNVHVHVHVHCVFCVHTCAYVVMNVENGDTCSCKIFSCDMDADMLCTVRAFPTCCSAVRVAILSINWQLSTGTCTCTCRQMVGNIVYMCRKSSIDSMCIVHVCSCSFLCGSITTLMYMSM